MTQTVEQQLTTDLKEVKETLNALRNALIGSEFGEGRIPRLEAEVREIDSRVKALERFHWKSVGAIAVILALFEAAMHLLKH
jgi:septal ring factor EnvC (AmiA/AmiB activator)